MGFGRKDVTKIEERKEGRKRKKGRTEGMKEEGLEFMKKSNMHGMNGMKERISR